MPLPIAIRRRLPLTESGRGGDGATRISSPVNRPQVGVSRDKVPQSAQVSTRVQHKAGKSSETRRSPFRASNVPARGWVVPAMTAMAAGDACGPATGSGGEGIPGRAHRYLNACHMSMLMSQAAGTWKTVHPPSRAQRSPSDDAIVGSSHMWVKGSGGTSDGMT